MQNTLISWATHTFNPWIGCTKVSPGCANCYAEAMDHRWGHDSWGPGKPRRRTSAAYWRDPIRWNGYLKEWEATVAHFSDSPKDAEERGFPRPDRPRVFCASLADWLDEEVPIKWLADLLDLIRQTPNLDWLLLTKRPVNWYSRISEALAEAEGIGDGDGWEGDACTPLGIWLNEWTRTDGDGIPANVWVGTSVEDQARADERIPALLAIPAKVRFLSCEPFLGPVDLQQACDVGGQKIRFNWVIVGGESGPHCRGMAVEWAQSLRRQCAAARLAFWMKQLGGHPDKRHELADLPEDLQVRQLPSL